MIYTVTFNPALDYIVKVDNFQKDEINRTKTEMILPGGKGINVSIVLKQLGLDNVALGFVADFTGQEIEKLVQEYGVKTDFIHVQEGFSRINVKITSEKETAVNGNGPNILSKDVEKLFGQIDQLKEEDVLVLSGSIPKVIKNDAYEQICKRIENKNIKVVVDATGELLVKVLPYHPFLIKPNLDELGEIFGTTIRSKEEIIQYAKRLQEKGARNVLISMGGKGAFLIDEFGKDYFCEAPKGNIVHTVGAGDSMVAGFLAGYIQNDRSYEIAFKTGVAAGSASTFSQFLATKEEVLKLLKEIETKEEF